MNRRLLLWTGLVALVLMTAGLLGVDYPLTRWVAGSGYQNAAFFREPLDLFDTVLGVHVWYWLACSVLGGLGVLGLLLQRPLGLPSRLPPSLIAVALTQAATIGMMILGKTTFGRMRPENVLASGNWDAIWFMGGGSFPSGHSAFYFGLFLPLAALAPKTWQRVVLLAIPVFVVCARINMSKHFLSDVAGSALVAALAGLLVSVILRRWLAPR
ncbi:phosphatase PAP2 family protein [Dokdonella sp. MW10]|uniref:phosphatase PAP2 family protein n=1 Tax=Dokdonella sp. MW10 TaxID=2992926 RepID=UPI003F7F7098